MQQPHGVPLGYFLTFSAYGNRLHGDERGTVDREHNAYGEPGVGPQAGWSESARARMNGRAVLFDDRWRRCIEQSFVSVCEYRGWTAHAVHCRTNHAHVVVSSDAPIDRAAHDLKAYATRALRKSALACATQPVWASHASMRYLWSDEDVAAAVEYSLEGQGADLPGTRVWDEHHQDQ